MVNVRFTWQDIKELKPNWTESECRSQFGRLDRELEEAMVDAAWDFLNKKVKKIENPD
jgi:hypothetical protein